MITTNIRGSLCSIVGAIIYPQSEAESSLFGMPRVLVNISPPCKRSLSGPAVEFKSAMQSEAMPSTNDIYISASAQIGDLSIKNSSSVYNESEEYAHALQFFCTEAYTIACWLRIAFEKEVENKGEPTRIQRSGSSKLVLPVLSFVEVGQKLLQCFSGSKREATSREEVQPIPRIIPSILSGTTGLICSSSCRETPFQYSIDDVLTACFNFRVQRVGIDDLTFLVRGSL
jgi:hypothetical protein